MNEVMNKSKGFVILAAVVLASMLALFAICSDADGAPDVGDTFVADGMTYKVASADPAVATITGFEAAPGGALMIAGSVEYDGVVFDVTVGKKAFAYCYGITSLTIGADVGQYAFYKCTGLKKLVILDGVKNIEKSAFSACTGLHIVSVADSVESIGVNAFHGCKFYFGDDVIDATAENLAGYKFTGTRTHLAVYVPAVGGVFAVDNVKYKILSNDESKTVAVKGFVEDSKILCVPESVSYRGFEWDVVSIASKAFYKNNFLCTVDIEMNGSIGYRAFASSSVEKLTVSGTVTVGNYAFASCKGLSKADLSGVTEIGTSAFSACTGLKEVRFSPDLSSVGKNAFFRNLFSAGEENVPRTAANLAGKMFRGESGALAQMYMITYHYDKPLDNEVSYDFSEMRVWNYDNNADRTYNYLGTEFIENRYLYDPATASEMGPLSVAPGAEFSLTFYPNQDKHFVREQSDAVFSIIERDSNLKGLDVSVSYQDFESYFNEREIKVTLSGSFDTEGMREITVCYMITCTAEVSIVPGDSLSGTEIRQLSYAIMISFVVDVQSEYTVKDYGFGEYKVEKPSNAIVSEKKAAGLKFKGWSYNEDSSGDSVNPRSFVNVEGNLHLYAIWK